MLLTSIDKGSDMKLKFGFALAVLLAMPGMAAYSGTARAADPQALQARAAPAMLERVGEGRFRLGDIVIDKNNRSITFPAQVNMDKGMLEYLIVHRKGKTHESLLNTLVEGYDLQVAFLLLGYEGSGQKLAHQGDPSLPQGDPVRIVIRQKNGVELPAEQWLINRFPEGDKDVAPMRWVYTGSFTDQGMFLAHETGSLVAIWHDPVALVDNASPGGESNRIWFVKEGTAPPVGTPVDVVVIPAKQ
jgi:hypothetical protein